jgi:hypothetical protein
MKKLSLIGFLLVLPTTIVTFFWLVSVGGFDWVEGMRCAPALIVNGIAALASVLIAIVADDEECAVWVNNWKDHTAPEESSKEYEIQQFKGWKS